MKTLTIVSPVFNEEEIIVSFYQELKEVLDGLNDRYISSILLVSDGSTDCTLPILAQLACQDKSLQILALSRNFGQQMAIIAGLDHCNSEIVIMMDSDLQHPPLLIPKMISYYEQGYDIVASKREDSYQKKMCRVSISKLIYRLIKLISDVPIIEDSPDFRLLSQKVLRIFQSNIRERNQFLRGLFCWGGWKTYCLPFTPQERKAGKSKFSLPRKSQLAMRGVVSLSNKPLKVSGLFGLTFTLLAVASGFACYVRFLLEGIHASNFSLLLMLCLFFSGVQLLCLWILGEYIGAILDEVRQRPLYIIDQKINID